MPLYEHTFMARQDVTSQQVEALIEGYRAIIEAANGKIAKVEYWGIKQIAYRVKKNRKAHYTLLNIDAPYSAVAEMERQMGISEDVLRFLTIKVDALEEGPSAMMQKRDREDRRDREDKYGADERPRRARRDESEEGEDR